MDLLKKIKFKDTFSFKLIKLKNINVTNLIYAFSVFFMIGCPYLEENFGILDKAFMLGRVACTILIVFFICKKGIRFNFFNVFFSLYYIMIFISSMLYSGFSLNNVIQTVQPITYVILLEMLMKNNQKKLIRILSFIFTSLVLLNFITIVLFPRGLYNIGHGDKHYYLLGHQNQTGLYILIATTISMIKDKMFMKTKNFSELTYLVIFASFMSCLLVWSSTSLVCYTLFISLVFLSVNFKKTFPFKVKLLIPVGLILFLSIVIFQSVDFLSDFIQNTLHRDMTFSGRTLIWKNALKQISKNFIFGSGLGQLENVLDFTSTHNRYLNVLFKGGFIAFCIWLIIQYIVYKKCDKNSKNPVIKIFMSYFSVLIIATQFESYDTCVFLTIFVIANYYRINKFNPDKILRSNLN